MFCAFAPLVCGVLIFFGWAFTGYPIFQILGVFNIIGGLILVGLGIVCLTVYMWQAHKNKIDGRGGQGYKAVGLLLSNFPAAFFLILLSTLFPGATKVIVENRSAVPIENLSFQDPLKKIYEFGAVAPNTQVMKHFRFRGEGGVHYNATYGGTVKNGVLIGYISNMFSVDERRLLLKPEGEIQVVETVVQH